MIYNSCWLENSIHDLQNEQNKLEALRLDLQALQSALQAECRGDISQIFYQVDHLMYSIRETCKALQNFKGNMEYLNRESEVNYENAMYQAIHIFD